MKASKVFLFILIGAVIVAVGTLLIGRGKETEDESI